MEPVLQFAPREQTKEQRNLLWDDELRERRFQRNVDRVVWFVCAICFSVSWWLK